MPKSTREIMANIEYLDDIHTYLVDGVIVPSVSKLVAFAVGSTYANISPEVLQRAADYGTSVHNAIEEYESSGNINEELREQVERYKVLKEENDLKVASMEQMVSYQKSYCGRYDILDAHGILWDMKCTSKVHAENLEWQLGLYYLGLGVEKEKGYCIWLPKKGKAKVVEIKPKTNEECKKLVEMYEISLTSNNE